MIHHMCIPKIWFLGSTFTWTHNLFVLWVLGFLLWVVLCLMTQMHSYFLKPFSLPHRVTPFLFQFSRSFLLRFLTPFYNPHSSFSSPIPLTSANGAPIPSSLNGCSIGKGGNGIEIDSHLQKPARQRYSRWHYWAIEYRVSPSKNTSDRVRDNWEGLVLGIQDGAVSFQLLGLDQALRRLD